MKAAFYKTTYCLVLCGGNSSRMGSDKGLLKYYKKPQRYHVYDMLLPFCEKVFISCNAAQANSIEEGYAFIKDDEPFNDIGPMAALLTAFAKFPNKNMLLIGCDYPFLRSTELGQFAAKCKDVPIAFYNEEANIYEPLLAWYPSVSFSALKEIQQSGHSSLQHFLKDNKAGKYYPVDKNSIISIDTYEDYLKAFDLIKQ